MVGPGTVRARAMRAPNEKALRRGHVAVRLDPATIARLDALLPLYALPGRSATRSDGLRAVILAGLEMEERRAARPAETKADPPGANEDP
jgi:hypothetical protein